jgi:hypothetical protein
MQDDTEHIRSRRRTRKRRKSRRGDSNAFGFKESAIIGILITAFLIAIGFCLWVLLPPLLRYLSESPVW